MTFYRDVFAPDELIKLITEIGRQREIVIMASKGKMQDLIKEHSDQTEFNRFNEYFPTRGYEVEYFSHLWGNKELKFGANPDDGVIGAHVTVTTEDQRRPARRTTRASFAIGAYATDRLRYQVSVKKRQKNNAPAVAFLRKAGANQGLKLSEQNLPLAVAVLAEPDLMKGRKVTCEHNIICDVENAGGDVVFEGDVRPTW